MTGSTASPASPAPPPSDWRPDAASVAFASNLIAYFEQFLQAARWDINAYRNGFGSDTEGAAQTPVTKGETTTKADALANLSKRVPNYIITCRGQIGGVLYDKLGPCTRAALASMAYNYGRIPASVVAAVRTNGETVSSAIRACGRDNNGVNQWRRDGEAACVALDGGQY